MTIHTSSQSTIESATPMTPQRWQEVERLFRGAVQQPAKTRQHWLEKASDGDPVLMQEVTALLAAEINADSKIDQALRAGLELLGAPLEQVSSLTGGQPTPEVEGYQILHPLGQGGTSTVFLATAFLAPDTDPKQVALKVLKREFTGRHLEQRFATEQQLLRRLEHPCIARFLDAGQTLDGRPFVTTEWIDGVPIDQYCRHLSLEDKLKVFQQVCAAVQHAHRHLIIHRDIKSANILVTPEGTPKLLDFGLGRQLLGDLPVGQSTTTSGRMLTPVCASPEQIQGLPLTIATDIYSLGVLLYQLLTGHHPQEKALRGNGDLAQAILTEEPTPPSQKQRSPGQRNPSRASRHIPVDLDAIVLKTLRKEPEHRYATVEQLSNDLNLLTAGRPVTAHKGAFGYRLTKLLRRHRVAAISTVLLFTTLITFLVVTTVQKRNIAQAQLRSQRSLSLLVDLLSNADPIQAQGLDLTAKDLLDHTAQQIPRTLADQPKIQATLMDAIGTVYMRLGSLDQAESLLTGALELTEPRDRQSLEHARSLLHLAELREHQAKYEDATEIARQVLAIADKEIGGDPQLAAKASRSLADALHGLGRYGEAEANYREALRRRREIFGEEHALVAESLNDLGVLAHERGLLEEAEPLYRKALQQRRRFLGPNHPDVFQSLGNLGALLSSIRQFDRAEAVLLDGLALGEKIYGDSHSQLLAILGQLATIYLRQRDTAQAEPWLLRAADIYRHNGLEQHPDKATNLYRLGLLYIIKNDRLQAKDYFRRSLALYEKTLSPDHPWTSYPMTGLGQVLTLQGHADEAEPLLRKSMRLRSAMADPRTTEMAEVQVSLGACLVELERFVEARPLLEQGTAILQQGLGQEHRMTLFAQRFLKKLNKANLDT